jgi:hypothetical protein
MTADEALKKLMPEGPISHTDDYGRVYMSPETDFAQRLVAALDKLGLLDIRPQIPLAQQAGTELLKEGRVRKGGRNQEPSEVTDRPPPPGPFIKG